MSFFMVLKGRVSDVPLGDEVVVRPICQCQVYLQDAAKVFFGVSDEVFAVASAADDTCQELIEITQRQLANGHACHDTKLGNVILEATHCGCSVCLWWATESKEEFERLVSCADADTFLAVFSQAILQTGGFQTIRC
jgi:hypothetical protein